MTRFAVDTNFLLDCYREEQRAITAWEVVRAKVEGAIFIVPPVIQQEFLNHIMKSDPAEKKFLCDAVKAAVPNFGFRPMPLQAVNRGIVEQISYELRRRGLIPDEEHNDATLMAEACLLDCSIVITDDGHLVGDTRRKITAYLSDFGASSVALRPSEILKRFGIEVPRSERA